MEYNEKLYFDTKEIFQKMFKGFWEAVEEKGRVEAKDALQNAMEDFLEKHF